MSEVYTYFSWQADCPVQILITHGCTAADQRHNKFSETGSGLSVILFLALKAKIFIVKWTIYQKEYFSFSKREKFSIQNFMKDFQRN